MQTLCRWRKAPNGKTLGIEIEMATHAHQGNAYHGFFYDTRDGSIKVEHWNHCRTEWVSQPLPAEWLKKEITKLYSKHIQGAWYVNDSCGIHIHVSRKWLSEQKAEKIDLFLKAMARLDRIMFFGREGNDYCEYHADKGSRYRHINYTNKATIEFRMFKSGDAAWAKWCVDCVVYLIEHANHLNFDAFDAFRILNQPKEA